MFDEKWKRDMQDEFERKRRQAYEEIKSLPHIVPHSLKKRLYEMVDNYTDSAIENQLSRAANHEWSQKLYQQVKFVSKFVS
jgi:type IV secretory pathway VirB4 component